MALRLVGSHIGTGFGVCEQILLFFITVHIWFFKEKMKKFKLLEDWMVISLGLAKMKEFNMLGSKGIL